MSWARAKRTEFVLIGGLLCLLITGFPTPGVAESPIDGVRDIVRLGTTVGEAGAVVLVPVIIADREFTSLDEGNGPDMEIQGFAFRAEVDPLTLQPLGFVQAGITDGLTASFPVVQVGADHIIVALNFPEATDPLDFELDPAGQGDLVGYLQFEILPAAVPGTPLDVAQNGPTTLVNDSATIEQSIASGEVIAIDGTVEVVAEAEIFDDGFENGTTGAWSSVVGPP